MNGKLLIPIFIFITCQFFYDLFGVDFVTRWSIFYYSAQYLSWLVLVILIPKKRGFINKLPYWIIGVGIFIYLCMEFRYWNYSWDLYYKEINEFKKYILPIAAIITGSIYYLLPIKLTITKFIRK